MFLVPDPPSYRFVYEEWVAYRDLLLEKYAGADGVSAALAEANTVVEFLEQEQREAAKHAADRGLYV